MRLLALLSTFLALPAFAECLEPGPLPLIHARTTLGEALSQCAKTEGCIIALEPRLYPDEAVLIGNGSDCRPEHSACIQESFPRGLVIQGSNRTVLRSPVFGGHGAVPRAVLEWARRPDFGPVVVRDVELDGQKALQAPPVEGVNNEYQWWHAGVRFQSLQHPSAPTSPFCAERVHARDFLNGGLLIGNATGGAFDVTVEDVGCIDGYLDCPLMASLPPRNPASDSRAKVTGGGLGLGRGTDGFRVENYVGRRIAKYAGYVKGSPDGSDIGARHVVWVNPRIEGTGHRGLFFSGVSDARVEGGLVQLTHSEGFTSPAANTTAGLTCVDVVSDLTVDGLRIEDASGKALDVNCGPGPVSIRATVTGACRERKGNAGYPFGAVDVTKAATGRVSLDLTMGEHDCAEGIVSDRSGARVSVTSRPLCEDGVGFRGWLRRLTEGC